MNFKLEEIEECSKSESFSAFMELVDPLIKRNEIVTSNNIETYKNIDVIKFTASKWGKGDLFLATLEQIMKTRKLILNFL